MRNDCNTKISEHYFTTHRSQEPSKSSVHIMAIENNGSHRCLKITLLVLYSIGVALSFILLALTVITLVTLSTIDNDHSQSTDADRKSNETVVLLLIAGIVALAFNLLFDSIALLAIVKEKKHILAGFTALQVVFSVLDLLVGYPSAAIGQLVMAIMLGVFTHSIFKREKLRQSIMPMTQSIVTIS